jgi:glucosamine--fructose-6-phosphate aminotransferase (isomerizing)
MYVIGRGPGFGSAQEAALKLKETCNLHAEAFSAAEVLHGPAALVREGFPILAFSQNDESRDGILAVAERLRAGGARMLLAGLQAEGAITLPTIAASPLLEPILMTQSFYRMAEALSRARGQNPDSPPHLQKVTETV